MKRIGYLALFLVLMLLTGVSSCVVNKDTTLQASRYSKNGIYDRDFRQAGYASVHSRPPIN